MDELVLRAMARWPSVPAVYGWLRLDRRGRWFLIDRARPDFDESRDRLGSEITSPPILDFIGRNYAADRSGAWYWQNGPQRVFVDLDRAPLVVRVLASVKPPALVTHTGYRVSRATRAFSTPDGTLYIDTDIGPALVHDLDLASIDIDEKADGGLMMRIGADGLPIEPIDAEPADRLHFVRRPRPT